MTNTKKEMPAHRVRALLKMVMAKQTAKKTSRISRSRVQHTVVLRMLIMAAVDLAGILTLQFIRREAMRELAFVNDWLTPLAIVFGVLAAASLGWLICTLVRKTDLDGYPVTPAMALCVFLFCMIACLIYKSIFPGAIIIASVTATVLFLVYCLYMHIFYR